VPHTFHPNYLKSIEELKSLFKAAKTLLENRRTRFSSYLEQQGYVLFEKLELEVNTLFQVIPGAEMVNENETEVWDISLASVLGRQVLEDCVTFLYLVEPNLLVEQTGFRELVWKYHSDKESVEIADLYGFLSAPDGPQNAVIPVLKKQAEARLPGLKKTVLNHPCFDRVDGKLRGKIKKGEAKLVLQKDEILSRFGITKSFYDAPYKNLSQFVHSTGFSLNVLPQTKIPSSMAEANFHLICIFVNFLFATALGEAIRSFGGTRSLNKEVEFIRTRNRGVLETAQKHAGAAQSQ